MDVSTHIQLYNYTSKFKRLLIDGIIGNSKYVKVKIFKSILIFEDRFITHTVLVHRLTRISVDDHYFKSTFYNPQRGF